MSVLSQSQPAAAGVDPSAVTAFVDALDAQPGIEMHGFMLARHGVLVAQGWWAPYHPDLPHLLYSCSKTFTALAYAFAETEGLLDRDQPLIAHWPEHADVAGERASRWTPRMLLRMASGHTQDWALTDTQAMAAIAGDGEIDAVARAFASEPDEEPGSVWCYNQLCTYLIAATVEKLTGQSLVDYLRPRLFDPVGVGDAMWQRDNRGRCLGFTGLHVPLHALLHLAQLHLDRGTWQGRRLLPEAWFDEASQPLSDNSTPVATVGTPPAIDWGQGYGYQLWMARHGYRGDGAYGQYAIVLPEQGAVLAINSQTDDMQAILDIAWDVLLPGLGAEASDDSEASDDAGEAVTFGGLTIAPLGGDGPGGSFVEPGQTYDAGMLQMPVPVSALAVTRDGAGWQLDLSSRGQTLTVPAGDGSWVAGELAGREGPLHLRSSAGWVDGRFEARVILVTTPHTLVLSGDPSSGELTARWSTPPLRGVFPTDLGLPG